jgi:hypothetical protein
MRRPAGTDQPLRRGTLDDRQVLERAGDANLGLCARCRNYRRAPRSSGGERGQLDEEPPRGGSAIRVTVAVVSTSMLCIVPPVEGCDFVLLLVVGEQMQVPARIAVRMDPRHGAAERRTEEQSSEQREDEENSSRAPRPATSPALPAPHSQRNTIGGLRPQLLHAPRAVSPIRTGSAPLGTGARLARRSSSKARSRLESSHRSSIRVALGIAREASFDFEEICGGASIDSTRSSSV